MPKQTKSSISPRQGAESPWAAIRDPRALRISNLAPARPMGILIKSEVVD